MATPLPQISPWMAGKIPIMLGSFMIRRCVLVHVAVLPEPMTPTPFPQSPICTVGETPIRLPPELAAAC